MLPLFFSKYSSFLLVVSLFFVLVSPIDAPCAGEDLHLSDAEKQWIMDHPVVRIAPDPDFPPIDFFDEKGDYKGIAADYIKLMEKETGLEFEVVRLGSWDEVLRQLRSRQADAIPAAAQTPGRRAFLLFSDPHIVLPGVIITSKAVKGRLSMEDILAMKVSIVKGYVWQELINTDYPDLKLDLVDDVPSGLIKVSLGESDAMVATLPVAIHHIEKQGITNLRVAGETGYHTRLSFASRSDWPELNTIVKKVLSRIPRKERDAILNKWISINEVPFLASRFHGILIITCLQLLFIITFIFGWRFHKKRFAQQYPYEKTTTFNMLFAIVLLFIVLGMIIWLDELFDMFNLITGAPVTPINFKEAFFETVCVYVLGMVAVSMFIHDINLRKISEDSLRESEEKFRSLAQSTPTAIMIYQGDKWVYANPAATQICGYTQEELLSMNFWEFIHPDYRPLIQDRGHMRQQGLSAEKRYEFKIITKAGQERWVDLSGSTTMFKGNPAGIISVMDITDRKQAQKALEESEETYRRIFETTGNATVIFDERGRLLLVNKEFERLSGYSKNELVGKKYWMDFVSGNDLARMKTHHRTALKDPRSVPRNFEFRFIDRAGTSRDIFLTSAMIVGTQKNISSLLDITGRKKLEFQLLQAQKMEAIGVLAGGIAHDFNNILTAIQWSETLLLQDVDTDNPQFEKLKSIDRAVNRATDLTKQLLGFARGGKYEVRPINLNELLKEDTKMFVSTKKEVALHAKYKEGLCPVEADRSQITQVFMNLYINASQAMPEGGDLYIETDNVNLDEGQVSPHSLAPGRYVKVSITDTGVGMDEATKARIFEPFFTTKEMGRGTGLGLASAYGIIKSHKGFITVYSEKGAGTTFNIYLLATDKPVAENQAADKKVLRGTETILLVDDEPFILDAGKNLLGDLGYEVLTAKNGKEAIEIYKKNHHGIDMVILDMIMPGFGGGATYDALKEIKADVRVILSSGYSLNGQAARILEKGCNGFIQKPYRIVDLSRKIREILDNEINHPA